MDREHQDGGKQIMRPDQKGIFDHGQVGVFNACQKREKVEQDNYINDSRGDDQRHQDRPENGSASGGAGTQMVENISISAKENPDGQHDEPKLCCLLEILFEGMEKELRGVKIFFSYDFQTRIIKRGGGSADGEDWQGADQPEQVQQTGIADLDHDAAECGIVTEIFHLIFLNVFAIRGGVTQDQFGFCVNSAEIQ